MTIKLVKLTKNYKNLFAGEQAGFEEAEADYIVAQRGGEIVKVLAPEKEAPKK